MLDLAFDASHYAAPVAEHHARCVLHWMRIAAGTSRVMELARRHQRNPRSRLRVLYGL